MQGETRAEYDSLRSQIIHCLAQVEALIDFGEGEDIEEGVYELGIDNWPNVYLNGSTSLPS